MSDRLTVADARRAHELLYRRAPLDDGRSFCPVCDPSALHEWTATIAKNGKGARLACSNGCNPDAIGAAFSTALRLAGQRNLEDDPLQTIRETLRLPGLVRVVKQGRTGEAYDLELDDGRTVELGDSGDLFDFRKLRKAIAGQADVVIPRLKPAELDAIAERLIREGAANVREVPTAIEQAAGWITAYLDEVHHERHVDLSDSPRLYELLEPTARPPLIDTAGSVHVRLEHLAYWINRLAGLERIGTRELATRLSRLGFATTQLSARRGSDVRKSRYWASPASWEPTR